MKNRNYLPLIGLMVSLMSSCMSVGIAMDNDALKLLKKSEKKFNEAYAEAGKPIDLANCDLSGMKIKEANLTGANMRNSNLKKTVHCCPKTKRE